MEVEYRIESNHFGYNDLALEKAVEKYTSKLWPFGRYQRARETLEEKQTQLLKKHGIEKRRVLSSVSLVVTGVDSREEAERVMEDFKEDIDVFYQDEFKIDEPFEYSVRNGSETQ